MCVGGSSVRVALISSLGVLPFPWGSLIYIPDTITTTLAKHDKKHIFHFSLSWLMSPKCSRRPVQNIKTKSILRMWRCHKHSLISYIQVCDPLPSPLFSSVQSLSHVWLFEIPWTAACQSSLSITNSWSLLKLMSTESVMPSNRLILCHPLLLLPSIFHSIRVFSNESALRGLT